ncbi:MAG: T9SS type A sorting domain-containing protein [Bacteroidales bacterium]|jgi:hypothetical protein|nr:T9SS type A sorting domain-containing protein [Bacteroidales bacterium]
MKKIILFCFIASLAMQVFAQDESRVLIECGSTVVKMYNARNFKAPNKDTSPTLYEAYLPIEAGQTFHLTVSDGITGANLGGKLDMVYNGSGTGYTPAGVKAYYYTSSRIQDEGFSSFEVSKSGLYHVVYESNLNKVVICEVNWGYIGSASSWTWLPMTGSEDFKTWTIDDIECIATSQFQLTYDGAYSLGIDDTLATAGTIAVGTSFGSNNDAISFSGDTGLIPLTPCGSNYSFPAENKGMYRFIMTWSVSGWDASWSAKMIKLADVNIDPAERCLAVIGTLMGSAWATDIPMTYLGTTGDISSYVATNIDVAAADELKIRLCGDWGTSWGYAEGQLTGDPGNFTNAGGNIRVIEAKVYDTVRFNINWDNGDYTIHFVAPGSSSIMTLQVGGRATVKVFPNPVTDKVLVEGNTEIKRVELFDMNGRNLYRTLVGSKSAVIDLTSYSKGVYMLRTTSSNGSTAVKIVKK